VKPLTQPQVLAQGQNVNLTFSTALVSQHISGQVASNTGTINTPNTPSMMQVRVPEQMSEMMRDFVEAGYCVLLVGDIVKDLLTNKLFFDVNIITNMPVEVLLTHFKKYSVTKASDVSGHYQMMYANINVDIVCCESEIFTSWEVLLKDAKTRTFTVNALYCDIQGRVYDPLQVGIHHLLHSPILRVIDDDLSWFERDPCVMLSAVRLSIKYGLTIPAPIGQAIQRFAQLVKKPDSQRLHIENRQHFLRGEAVKNFNCLINLGLFNALYPETSLFLQGSEGAPYHAWLCQELDQTDQLIMSKSLASIAYVYALFLSGSALLKQKSQQNGKMKQIVGQVVLATFPEGFEEDFLSKIEQMTVGCIQRYQSFNSPKSNRPTPLVFQFQAKAATTEDLPGTPPATTLKRSNSSISL